MSEASCPPVGMRLRRLRWWDLPAAVAMEQELFPSDAWTPELFWSELAGVPRTRWYVAAVDSDDALVGYAGLASVGGTGDVQTLAVRHDRQGIGLGGRLLDALMAQARQRRCGTLLLEVRADNEPAKRLYAGRGFERISIRRGYYDAGRTDAWVLRARLSAGDAVAGSEP